MTEGKMDGFEGHTMGPWQVVPDSFSADVLICDEKRGDSIAFIGFGQSKNRRHANARLIAAAPDLLAALRAVQRIIGQDSATMAEQTAVLRQMREAIAKAEGKE